MLKNSFFVGNLKVNDENSRIRIQDPNPDPLVRGMDPRIRIRIHPKMSWIRNTFRVTFNPRNSAPFYLFILIIYFIFDPGSGVENYGSEINIPDPQTLDQLTTEETQIVMMI